MSIDDGTGSRIDQLKSRIRELEKESSHSTSLLENLNMHQEELRLQNEQLRETQGALETARERYVRLFDFLPIGVLVVDTDGVVQEANRAIVEMSGRRRDWIVGRPVLPLFHNDNYSALSKRMSAAASGHTGEMDASLVPRSGVSTPVHIVAAPVGISDATDLLFLTVTDIREQTSAREKLSNSEQRFRSVIEQTPVGVCVTRRDYTFEYVNEAYCEIYGYRREELIDQPFTIVVPESDRGKIEAAHDAFIAGTVEFSGEHKVLRKDGTEITVETVAALYNGTDGAPRKATFVVDVTDRRRKDEQLLRFRRALDTTPDAVFLVDIDTFTFIDVNEPALCTLGYTRDEILDLGPDAIDVQKTWQRVADTFDEELENGDAVRRPMRSSLQKRDGSILPVEIQFGVLRSGDTRIVISIARDITERLHNESELRRINRELDRMVKERTDSLNDAHRQLQLMKAVMENSLNGVAITDRNGVVQQINHAFSTVTGYQPKEVIGKNAGILKSGHHDSTFYQKMWAKLEYSGEWQGEIWNRRRNGEVYPEWLQIRAIYNNLGETTHYVAIFYDLTELHDKEREVDFQTHHDALTGLHNRAAFLERAESAIRNARRTETGVAVAIVDIDEFRKVNERSGHTIGDAFLAKTAQTLRSVIDEDATLARIGGDEFAVLIEGITEQWDYLGTTERLASIDDTAISHDENEFGITVTLGVALFPEDGDQAEQLLNFAEAALYQAKTRPRIPERGRVGMYTPELDEALRRRISLETEMRADLEAGRFCPYYQPRVDLATKRVIGAEALARWVRADGSVVSPAEFIPLAEETGLIVDLGEEIRRAVYSDITEAFADIMGDVTISFNASIKEISDPRFVPRLVETFSGRREVEFLEIELTESVVMDDIDNSMPVLEAIQSAGFSLAIDDFGTGYSSLYYLKRLPIDVLKIDKSFIDEVATDANDQTIVATISAMGKALGLRLVAEGIETTEQETLLCETGCSEGQGYLYGKPMNRDAFAAYLREQQFREQKERQLDESTTC